MKSKLIFFVWLSIFGILGFLGYLKLIDIFANELNVPLRMSGKVSMIFITLALLIPPISSYISPGGFRDKFVQLRKIFGILGFYFFLFHTFQYVSMEWIFHEKYHSDIAFLSYFIENITLRPDAFSGIFPAGIITILGITSNLFSVRILGSRRWKNIQRLAYPLFVLVLIHIAYTSHFEIGYMLMASILVTARTFAFFHQKKGGEIKKIQNYQAGTQYRCIPCGYIYDVALGDPDSGIAPGTRFEDIPEDWRCPICGVTKKDFEPILIAMEEQEISTVPTSKNTATLTEKKMLTEAVVQLTFATSSPIVAKPGQYVSLGFRDHDGEFRRSYSIVHTDDISIVLTIKISLYGRGGKKLTALQVGDQVDIYGPFGEFVIQNTPVMKVFLATGTGLSPIMHMLKYLPDTTKKVLYFGVETSKDLFYESEIAGIKNLETHIFLSREEKVGYQSGRLSTKDSGYPKNTEFYICGNPTMVEDALKNLRSQGYTSVFHEIFS